VLWDGVAPARETRVAWDGTDPDGRTVPPGLYLARLAHSGAVESVRLLRMD
jgi:hypothetical protein